MKTTPPLKPVSLGVSWLAQLGIVSVLGYAAYLKLSDHALEIALFRQLGMEPAGRYIIGFLEALVCVLLVIPHAAVYGAILSVGIMLGAQIAHATKLGFDGATPWAGLIVLALSMLVAYLRRRQIPSVARMLH